jgi:imidazolonepropionase-like amidohydrolase
MQSNAIRTNTFPLMSSSASLLSGFRLGALALALSGAALGADTTADLVVLNGNILTLNSASSRVSAVAIKDGVFIAIGGEADIRKRVGPHTRILDARGQSVIPGLIESHVHATGAARGTPFSRSDSFIRLPRSRTGCVDARRACRRETGFSCPAST